jgi:hypothetical protein
MLRPLVCLCALAFLGCKQEPSRLTEAVGSPVAVAPPPAAPAPRAVAVAPPPPASTDDELSGVVAETMDAGGYTYARLDHGGTMLWVAGPETKLVVGSRLGKLSGTLMPSFHSSALNRTFDKIYFVNAYEVASAAIPNPHGASGAVAGGAATSLIEKVAPAAGGKTVADVFAGKATLAGKPVVVRAKVVKVSNGILGKNWLHLQDGTGAAGTNDLIATTQATAKVGDIIVVRGTVATNQDIGAGYRYEVLVDNATIADR